MEIKFVFGIIASAIGLAGYVPYFWNLARRKTKPHVFSWFVWGLMNAIGFAAQVVKGAGPGAWVTGISGACTLLIAIFAITRGERNITRSDWACLAAALLGIALWVATRNPLTAVVLITLTDAIAFIPTFRKAYWKPYEETMSQFVCSAIKYMFGLSAIASYSVTTALYPASLVVTNGAFVAILLIRRRRERS